jgi:hypothetical protein
MRFKLIIDYFILSDKMEVNNPQLLAVGAKSMVNSGHLGGNPVLSKLGIETKSTNICFADGDHTVGYKVEHDFGSFDIEKVPIDLIKEKIKLNLMGVDKDII